MITKREGSDLLECVARGHVGCVGGGIALSHSPCYQLAREKISSFHTIFLDAFHALPLHSSPTREDAR